LANKGFTFISSLQSGERAIQKITLTLFL